MAIAKIDTAETYPDVLRRIGLMIDELNRLGVSVPASAPLPLPAYTVETAPEDPADGAVIFVSDGDDGDPCLAVSSNGAWLRVALGEAIAGAE